MPAGRPTKYDPGYPEQAKNYCRLGAKDKELCEFFKISEDTLSEWKKVYPEFSASIREGKDIHDTGLVENALLKSARGFKRSIEKLDKDGCIVETKEEVPPNATSLIFWLKNRDQRRWKDKHEHEHSGNVVINANPFEKKATDE